ncbi:MAG: dipeptide ABC transporter ATP-binding protein [Desulfobacterales bacterium]
MPDNTLPTIEIEDLTIVYDTESGPLKAVRGASLEIRRRESFGLVGESGSGKTTLALGAIRYLAENGRILDGKVRLRGQSITDAPFHSLFNIWGKKIGMVYQNPGSAMNPSLTIGRQIAESAMIHQEISGKSAMAKATEMLAKVAMPNPETVLGLYPHQLSGGMLQRCIIAMGLINNPELLIMDEPTTALDVTTQAVVLDLVADLKRDFDSSILYITHDLAVVAKICDRIGVMYAGELVETGPKRQIFRRALHPYTLSLLGCIPHFEPESRKHSLVSIPGRIPRLNRLPEGCIFSPRCFFAKDRCRKEHPPFIEVAPDRWSSCFFWDELPRKVEDVAGQVKYQHPPEAAALLETVRLEKHYDALETFFGGNRRKKKIKALNDVSIQLSKGFTMGIVGESGCGKTTLMRTIIGLLEPTSGDVVLDDEKLAGLTSRRPRTVLRKIQMVFQNPDASLNPRQTIAQAIQRPLVLLKGLGRKEIEQRTRELLQAVNLPPHYYDRYPAELSGGEKQRAAIARAFAADPELVLLDEPLSALDVSVQASLINLLFDLQAENRATYLFISHDLAAVHHISDAVAVMYLGRIVENGDADDVFTSPYHPYTESLLSAIPVADPSIEQEAIRLVGSVPSAVDIPPGCPFHTRCPRKVGAICETAAPPWREDENSSRINCHIPLDELRRLQAGTITYGEKNGETA